MSKYSTGNAERDKILRRAIAEIVAVNEQITFEAIVANLPKDFDLEVEEAEAMAGDMGHLETSEPLVEHIANEIASGVRDSSTGKRLLIDAAPDGNPFPQEKIEAPHASEIEPPVNPSADAPPQPVMTQQQASDAVLRAHNDLQEARLEYRRTQSVTQAARAALATSISVWQTGEKPYTQQDLIRDHLRSEQDKRRQRIEQGVHPQAKQIGKSAIDRAAAYSRDNSAEGYTRNRNAAEGGMGGMHRGAFPKSMVGRTNYDPKRGAVPKLPSER